MENCAIRCELQTATNNTFIKTEKRKQTQKINSEFIVASAIYSLYQTIYTVGRQ